MSNNLQTILDEIKTDKDTNLKPENLKKGVSLLGVEGGLENNIKLYESLDELKIDTSCDEGTIGVILNQTEVSFTTKDKFEYLYLPDTIEVPNSNYKEMEFRVDSSDGTTYDFVAFQPIYGSAYTIIGGMSQLSTVYYDMTAGDTTTKGVRKSGINSIIPVTWGDKWYADSTITTDNLYGIKGLNISFEGIYHFNGTEWEKQPIGTTAGVNSIVNGKTAYTNNGIITGTLKTNYYKQVTIDDNTSYETFQQIVNTQATTHRINLSFTKTSYDDTWKPLELRDIYNGQEMTYCGDLVIRFDTNAAVPAKGLFSASSSMQYIFGTIKLSNIDISEVLSSGGSDIMIDFYINNSYKQNAVYTAMQASYSYQRPNLFTISQSCELQSGSFGNFKGELTRVELLYLIDCANTSSTTRTLTLPSDWYSLCTEAEWKVLTDKKWTIVKK